MDRMIFTALSGAKQTLIKQDVDANNMANANTTGFREQLSAFQSFAVPSLSPTQPSERVSTVMTTPGSDFTEGAIETTQRTLDVAIKGPGWLSVSKADGSEAFTRNGALHLDAFGMLVNSEGLAVRGVDNNPVMIPAGSRVEIAHDGTISALGAGDPPKSMTEVGQIKLVNPPIADLVRDEQGLFTLRSTDDLPPANAPADPSVQLISGALENSNISPTNAMLSMIENTRRFEMNMKGISTANDNASRANALLGPAGG